MMRSRGATNDGKLNAWGATGPEGAHAWKTYIEASRGGVETV